MHILWEQVCGARMLGKFTGKSLILVQSLTQRREVFQFFLERVGCRRFFISHLRLHFARKFKAKLRKHCPHCLWGPVVQASVVERTSVQPFRSLLRSSRRNPVFPGGGEKPLQEPPRRVVATDEQRA